MSFPILIPTSGIFYSKLIIKINEPSYGDVKLQCPRTRNFKCQQNGSRLEMIHTDFEITTRYIITLQGGKEIFLQYMHKGSTKANALMQTISSGTVQYIYHTMAPA